MMSMIIFRLAAALLAAHTLFIALSSAAGRTPRVDAVSVCAGRSARLPAVPGIAVRRMAAQPGDLPRLRITDARSGGWMYAYYDPASERVARASAPCLGLQLALLDEETGGTWGSAQWSSVVFTTQAGYIPPRTGEIRWTVEVAADGTLGAASRTRLQLVIPHEQVHAFQKRAGADAPRWFHEGHAEWIGRKVGAAIAPTDAAAEARRSADARAKVQVPLKLGEWGGVNVRKEAFQHQVSPEDWQRMQADPSYMPKGPFLFRPEDMISDESNTSARYDAAWRIFAQLEAKHGRDAVNRWADAVTATKGRIRNEQIIARAQAELGEDLSPLLK